MEVYGPPSKVVHPVYGKPAGRITDDDVAQRLHGEIQGKSVLITGCGLGSLGHQLAFTIAAHEPRLLVVCGRSDVRLRILASSLKQRNPGLNIRHEVFDLGDLSQVRAAAERINAYEETLDVVICSAGIMMHPLRRTVDGIESHLGVNSTGHFLLVNLLLPKMIAHGGGRVVLTTSGAYLFFPMRWEDPNYEKEDEYNPFAAYAASKTADVLFAAALARRFGSRGILAASVDVGGSVLGTNLSNAIPDAQLEPFVDMPAVTKAEGCSSQLVAAFDPELKDHNGAFLLYSTFKEPAVDHAKGEENEMRFWELSEKLVGQKFE